ncbi:periodic tryptophan protein 2 homolog [Microplitis demolitor]|uniref:periodic tryptophan protein 2 homolog n=1 Tax=Microplitis demolitor TaxID=69319 RepID=UPI0004CD5EFD|nr:periodic tryptophan protein 2 homolog [Microplitis demolitor]
MKFAYKFGNLLSTVYHKGNLLFAKDGSTLISPVGNRITVYDLKNNKSSTLPVESRYNYNAVDLSPNGAILVAVNEEGEAHVISMMSKIIIHKYRFKKPISCIKFSPDGKYLAVCKQNNVFIFSAPGLQTESYNPFEMKRVFHSATDETTTLCWSSDSRFLAVGSKDTFTKLYTLDKYSNFRYCNIGGHSDEIIFVHFDTPGSYDLFTIARNGHLCLWEASLNPEDLKLFTPAIKAPKPAGSDSEDDVILEKAIEQTKSTRKASKQKSSGSTDQDPASDQELEDKPLKFSYKLTSRHYLADDLKKNETDDKKSNSAVASAASYHQSTRILVLGFSTGSFFLYELPDVNLIHSLNVSNQSLSSIAFNPTGDWVALGSSQLGQLLVWEWQSETYVLKQQGHSNNMTSLAYSPDGLWIVTGGEDGKVKLWNTITGFCVTTFSEHTSSVTSAIFSHNRKFIVSASLDGTVRAHDLTRYRNFKTFTSPRPVQFSCVALDSSDEFVAAGGQDYFDIYLWSIKLGSLLEVMSGHTGPVAALTFTPSPGSTAMASVSWDKTLKLWNAIENSSTHETVQLTADGVAVVYRPDGKEVAVATLDGVISFFDVKTTTQNGSIEGRNDLGAGRSETDLITAKKNLEGKAFRALCYSADGKCILAGGSSKNVCIYDCKEQLLIKKFEITQNRSFDAVDDFINRRKMTEFGNLALVEEREEGAKLKLPGVKSGDMAARSTKPEVRVYGLQFSPTGQAWAAATTEGLLIYKVDAGEMFDPFMLEIDITPDAVREKVGDGDFAKALMMALKLNEKDLIRQVVEAIPVSDAELTIISLSQIYIERLLKFISVELEKTRHIHFYLIFTEIILSKWGHKINSSLQLTSLLTLQKNMQLKYDDLSKICDFNQYTIDFIVRTGELKSKLSKEEKESDNESDTSVTLMDIN